MASPEIQETNDPINLVAAKALRLQNDINSRTSDPDELHALASVAVDYLDEQVRDLYLDKKVRLSGTFYVPAYTERGIPDPRRVTIEENDQIDGRSKGFYYFLEVLTSAGLGASSDDAPTNFAASAVAETPASTRIQLGHLAHVGNYAINSFVGNVQAELYAFAPVENARLETIENIQAQRVQEVIAEVAEEDLLQELEIILLNDTAELPLEKLQDFFERLLRKPELAAKADDCLTYVNVMSQPAGKPVELIAAYMCLPDASGRMLAYTCDENCARVLRGARIGGGL